MHFIWPMTTVVLFISFFDHGKVKGSNLEIQATQKLKEMIELKEHLESLQKDIEKYISSFLNNNGLMKLNSMVQGLAQEKVIRINFGKKIDSMLEAYGQQLADLATTIDNIDLHIENRLLVNTNATEVSFRSKLEETVSTIEQKCTRSMSNLNQTLGNLYEQINQWRVPKQVHGGWTAWGSWTICTSTCGKGINNRVRTCTNPAPANGGNDCVGVALEYNECQISSCKANGGWTLWGSWSTCSFSCGNGLRHRNRTCTNPVPANGGQYCDGQPTEYSNCQIQPCEDNGNVKGNNLEVQVTQKLEEMINLKEHLESLQKDIEKHISSFLNNNGLMKLNSMVQALAQEKVIRINFGKKINSLLEAYGQQLADLVTTVDNIDRHIENRLLANTNATEALYGSKLEETIRTVEQKFKGSISKLNHTLENLCEEINQCRVPKQVHGGWTAWESWTRCTSTCGKGIINRVRTCTNPAPASGGNYCVGVPLEYKECQISSCEANGGWTLWGSWSTCSSSCGNGIHHRNRTCTNPVPANGGQYCDGQPTEYSNCQTKPCEALHCGDGWTQFQASCYTFVHIEMSWFAAEQYCQGFDSHLIHIDNYTELQFIRGKLYEFHNTRLKESGYTDSVYWTAGNDIRQEGRWVLSPLNVPMRYMYWFTNEPNNDNDGENCVDLAYIRLFQMNDLRCHLKGFVICEIDRKNG